MITLIERNPKKRMKQPSPRIRDKGFIVADVFIKVVA